MRKANNFNQLLSRVKSIFGSKTTPAANTPLEAEPPTDLSVVSDPRISAAFADIENYLAENYGTPASKLRYKDYTNGASLDSEDAVFAVSLVILTETEGAGGLPDNVMILGKVSTDQGDDRLVAELGKLLEYLKKLSKVHRIQHLALAFSKEKPDHPSIVQSADISCLRLY